jgi:uncharacterized membrane protein
MVTASKTLNAFPDTRIKSIDILRGAVMVLMAIDHVRVYSGIPAGGKDYGIFFTRWITHFCAPSFVFLAGTGIFLYNKKLNSKALLARYLVTRGLLLVLLELTLIRFFWTFNFNYSNFLLAGIIWMLGWCMVIMAALIWLKPVVTAVIGLAIIFFQQIFQYVPSMLPLSFQKFAGYFWEFIYPAGLDALPGVTVLYVLVPWIGVMAAGYGFGLIFLQEPEKRRRICTWIGLSAIALFVIIGSIAIVKQPSSNTGLPFILQLLNQKKYPASQLYLLMTLGPLIASIPFAEKATGWVSKALAVFGSVPLFYYILHILLIHTGALAINYFREGTVSSQWYATAPFVEMPPEHRWSLLLLYLEFACDVIILYFLCNWYAKYKKAHPEKRWLKFL